MGNGRNFFPCWMYLEFKCCPIYCTRLYVHPVICVCCNYKIHPLWMLFINSLVAGATINAIAAFEEESGWRGFLLNKLKHQSFIKTSFTIGLIWGVWHAPIILAGHNYPDHPCHGRVNDNHLVHSAYPAFFIHPFESKICYCNCNFSRDIKRDIWHFIHARCR